MAAHVPSRRVSFVAALACFLIAAGVLDAHAAVTPGTLVAWGANTYGQLGDGTVTPHHTPLAVAGLSSVVQIEGGREYGLARTADGSVYAWGWNRYGQVGTGSSGTNATRSARRADRDA